MRLVQISVSSDERDAVLNVIKDRDLGYAVTAGDGDQSDRSVIEFLVPADAVEYVLADLRYFTSDVISGIESPS
ncbi:MAG: hypothetical protein ABEI77_08080 [Halorientalis sp.]